jgi:hypothetical protein
MVYTMNIHGIYWKYRFQGIHGIGIGIVDGRQLGSWTSPRAGFLEDVLVERGERVAEFCRKFVRGYEQYASGIKFLENICLK